MQFRQIMALWASYPVLTASDLCDIRETHRITESMEHVAVSAAASKSPIKEHHASAISRKSTALLQERRSRPIWESYPETAMNLIKADDEKPAFTCF